MIDFVPPGEHRGRKVNERQLQGELEAAGVALAGVGLIKDENGNTVSIRLHLPQEPDADARRSIEQVLLAHSATPESAQPLTNPRLEELKAKRRAGQSLTTAEKQELLDILAGI